MRFFAGALAVFILAGSCLEIPSAVAAPIGQVIVTGSVPIDCNLVVQQAAGATGISNISAGHANLHIATVTESCNSPDGYIVSVTASNSGDHNGLFVDPFSTDSHPFTIRYDGVPVPVGGIVTDSSSEAFDVQKSVDITYPADNTLSGTVTDSYEETITFTMTAK